MARYQNYSTLVTIEAVASMLVIVVSGIGLLNGADQTLVPPQLLIGSSLIALAYYAIGHGLVKKKSEYLSALIMSVLSALGIVLLIIGTGGFESPYFAFWLGVIVVAGLFGRAATGIVVVGTLAVMGLSWSGNGFNNAFLMAHLPQIIGVIGAAALIEFMFKNSVRRPLKKTDDTEKLQAELTQEASKAAAIIAAMTEGVIAVDASSKITVMNDAAAIITGWSTSSAVGLDYHSVMQLAVKADAGALQASDPLQQVLTSGQPMISEALFITAKTGQASQLGVSISPIPNGAIIVMRDITQQKELERQKDEFISTASHEMRTPVAAIEGYLSLVMNPKVATIDDKARGLLQKAHDSTGHLATLFRDLLNVTKMEDGTKKLPREAVNLAGMVTSVVADMQFVAASKKLQLVMNDGTNGTESTVPQALYVMANPERLREAIMNLIENAIKYTQQGSVVVAVQGDGQQVSFQVTDTGPGIAPEDQPHLFEKFYRVAKTSQTVSGTGLGLYLCRSIIESFNGQVTLSSVVGQGSIFGFTLPQLSSEQVAKAQRDKEVLIQPTQ